jgi:hypothetical protein
VAPVDDLVCCGFVKDVRSVLRSNCPIQGGRHRSVAPISGGVVLVLYRLGTQLNKLPRLACVIERAGTLYLLWTTLRHRGASYMWPAARWARFAQKLETEPPAASGIVFMSGDSAAVFSATRALLPLLRMFAPALGFGSLEGSAVGRKGAEADFKRRISASKHRCEYSSSLRVSSILTMPIVLLQIGHTDSYVPLSLCVRMNLRGCWAANDGLFVARERPQR